MRDPETCGEDERTHRNRVGDLPRVEGFAHLRRKVDEAPRLFVRNDRRALENLDFVLARHIALLKYEPEAVEVGGVLKNGPLVESRLVPCAVRVARGEKAKIGVRSHDPHVGGSFLDHEGLSFEHRLVDPEHVRKPEIVLVREIGPTVLHGGRQRSVLKNRAPVLHRPLPDDLRLFGIRRMLHAHERSARSGADLLDHLGFSDALVPPDVNGDPHLHGGKHILQFLHVPDVVFSHVGNEIDVFGRRPTHRDRNGTTPARGAREVAAQPEDFVQISLRRKARVPPSGLGAKRGAVGRIGA